MRKTILNILHGKRSRATRSDTASGSTTRRHFVAKSPRSGEEDHPTPRGDMLLLGGMQDPQSASMRFSEPRGRTDLPPPPPPRRHTRSTAPPPYVLKVSEYGFMIFTEEEEERLKSLRGRIRANTDFDDDALVKLGFHGDIYGLLGNLGWSQFSINTSVDVHEDIAMEMFMTLKVVIRKFNDQEVYFSEFRLKDMEKSIPFDAVGTLLGFNADAQEKVAVEDGELENFWKLIAKDDNHQRKNISNVILQIFHFWMNRRIFGRMRESKVIDLELNYIYSGLVKKEPIDPTYVMIDMWAREASSRSREIGLGFYLCLIAKTLEPEVETNPAFFIQGTEFGLEAMRQGHYIVGDEKHGYKVANTSIILPEPRLKLFAQAREDWRDEKILTKSKKNKRGKHIGKSSAPDTKDVGTEFPQANLWESHAPSGQGSSGGW